MKIPIVTSFGSIRAWHNSDLDALVKYANNYQIWLNMRDGFHFPYTREHGRAFLEAVHAQNPVTFFALATPQEAIGGIGLSINSDVHRLTAELAYWLAEPYWGKRIMSEAVEVFSDCAFEQLGLLRIYAEPYAANLGSARVLEKAGFTLEGRMRNSVIKAGKVQDQLLYAKVRELSTGK